MRAAPYIDVDQSEPRDRGAWPRRDHVPAWEMALLLAGSLNYWTDLLRLAFPGVESASIAFRGVHFGFYGVFALLLARDLPALAVALRRLPFLLAFLALPLASVMWSVNAGETLTRAVALLGSTLYALYVATQLSPRLVLRVLAWTGGLAAAISLVLIAFVPSVGLMSEGEYVNVWSGAFVHKNGLGQMTALGAIIAVIVLLREGLGCNLLVACGLALNLVLLAGSRSLTSQVVFVASMVMIMTVGRFLRFVVQNAVAVAIMIGLPAMVAVATLSMDDMLTVLAGFGKDATMSSRVPLWQILTGFIDDRFWLGWGYEAFFTDENFAIRLIEAKLHFKPFYAHNGYLEIWLGLGAVGAAWMLALVARFAWLAATNLYHDDRSTLYLLAFVYVPIFVIQNAAESTILQRNSMSWSLFVVIYALVALRPAPWSTTRTERR